MTDVILIPYRGVNAEREANFRFVVDWYRPLGYQVTIGDSLSDRFNRAASRNAAAKGAGDWDRALIADADCVVQDLDVIRDAMDRAQDTGKLILPHDNFWRLSAVGTKKVLAQPWLLKRSDLNKYTNEVRLTNHMMPSGALVLTHKTYEKIGGYDERLVGWGYEDSEFLKDAEKTVGYERLKGNMIHLWHPRDTGTIAQREADRLVASQRKLG